MAEHDALATRAFLCWCVRPLVAVDNPATGVLVLSHGTDAHPLVLADTPLIARALAHDPALLDEPVVRDWLRGVHPAPD